MNVAREVVSVALYSLFTPLVSNPPTSTAPFAFSSRMYPAKATIEANPQPAFYLVEADENDDETQAYYAQRYILRYRLCIFGQTPDDGLTAPGTVLNPLLDAVDLALQKSPNGNFLYGQPQQLVNPGQAPLVANAWINGRVFKNYTELNPNQNYVVVPIYVITGQ